jgi:hypothetical protein
MTKSIMQHDKYCFLCFRSTGLERHHVFAGVANRKISEKYGLWIWLCHDCHTGKDGAQYSKEIGLKLKHAAQRAFEKDHSRNQWMQIIGKNYTGEKGKENEPERTDS